MSKLPRQNTMSKNPKLQDDIERNLKLREGAARILSMAANSIQRLDAAKTILVSNARLLISMQQLQREKTDEVTAVTVDNSATPSNNAKKRFSTGKATLCLSDIRIPLLWKDTSLTPNASATFNKLMDPNYQWTSGNSGGYSSATLSRHQRPLSSVLSMGGAGGENVGEFYSAFCIVRVGDQIRETRLLCEVRPGTSDLEFDDILTFENVQPDFECYIEIYGYQSSNDQGTMSFLRRKPQNDPASSAQRNSVFLGTLTPEYTKDLKTGQRVSVPSSSPASDCCFSLVARYTAKIGDLGSEVSAHQLDILAVHNHSSSASHLFFSSSPGGGNGTSGGATSFLSTVSAYPSSEDALPLFGPICFSLTAQPDSVHKPVRSGFLWMRELNEESERKEAKLYFCELRNQRLYARTAKPHERKATLTPVGDDTVSLKEHLERVRLRNPKTSARRKPPTKWDVVVKIDPFTKFLDDEPVCRQLHLSCKFLTTEEREHLVSPSKPEIVREHRRSKSTGDQFGSLISSSMSKEKKSTSDYIAKKDEEGDSNRSQISQIQGVEENQNATPPNTTANLKRKMFTLRVTSQRCPIDSETSLDEGGEGEITLEFAAFDALFSMAKDDDTEDSRPIIDWLSAMREHIEEQEKWGVNSFGQEVYIPEATSFTKHGTVIRASAIPEISTASFEALDHLSYSEESVANPVTAL
ncbi:hypothetical protein Aperf_G00000067403 [Anoplocephala perfoliata]